MFKHKTVLLDEAVSLLNLQEGDLAIDATAGGGGHSQKILQKIGPRGKLLCIDRDQEAIKALSKRFEHEIEKGIVSVVHSPFSKLSTILRLQQLEGRVSGILADFGASSPQFDNQNRGFSFMHEGPLDMRMDNNSQDKTAREYLQKLDQKKLEYIFREFGEEHEARRISKAIIRERETNAFETTADLSKFIEKIKSRKRGSGHHPATKVFQALRIFVNNEIDEINAFVPDAFNGLKTGGRLALISFHSLEDRIVKRFMTSISKGQTDNEFRHLPFSPSYLSKNHRAKIIQPFPKIPSNSEVKNNPRSRSAKLRVVEKI